jgi:hypothetical protein
MISPRRVAANACNAQRSTGPRSHDGKTRAGRNARRHGLAAFFDWRGPVAADLERLADEIAGPNPDSCRCHFALVAAEAEFELRRVRAARLSLVSQLFTDCDAADASCPSSVPIVRSLSRIDRYELRARSAAIAHCACCNPMLVHSVSIIIATYNCILQNEANGRSEWSK